MVIAFTFMGLRKEGRIEDDLDAIYHVLADEFVLMVNKDVMFREVDFPVIELASALDTWIRAGARRGELAFEPTGYNMPAFQFLSADSDWLIVSSQRPDTRRKVEASHLDTSIKRYQEDVATACRFVGVELNSLLRRLREYSGLQRQ